MKLDVFLFEKKCGSLFSTAERGIVFEYNDEYLSDKNAKPLSVSLPLSKKEFSQAAEYFIFQYFIGNCDAHGKNYSLLYKDGIRLAPAYDIVSTVVYPELSQNMSMKVANHYELEKIRKSHFVETFDECNVNSKVVNSIFEKFIDKANTIENVLNEDAVAKANSVLVEKIIARLKAASK